jgi:hypothetical protein
MKTRDFHVKKRELPLAAISSLIYSAPKWPRSALHLIATIRLLGQGDSDNKKLKGQGKLPPSGSCNIKKKKRGRIPRVGSTLNNEWQIGVCEGRQSKERGHPQKTWKPVAVVVGSICATPRVPARIKHKKNKKTFDLTSCAAMWSFCFFPLLAGNAPA